jgi:hypothetical protein
MGAPKAQQPPTDPMLDQLTQTAQRQQQVAMQGEAAGDTASLMARYGARLALGSAGSFGRAPAMAGFGSTRPA